MNIEELRRSVKEDEFLEFVESLSQNYTVWFSSLNKNYEKRLITELEKLTKDIAKTRADFVSFYCSRDIGVMIIEFKTRKLTYANGRLIDTKKHDGIKA